MDIRNILDIEDPIEKNEEGETLHWIIVDSDGKREKLSMTLPTMNILKFQIDAYIKLNGKDSGTENRKELRIWLDENDENVIANDGGTILDLTYYYEDYGIEKIWIEDEGETAIYDVAVRLPTDHDKRMKFLIEIGSEGEAVHFDSVTKLLHIHFDGC